MRCAGWPTPTAAISIRGAYEATGRLELPRPTVPPARPATRFLSLGGLYHHLPQEDFYGFGQQSSPDTHANFLLNESTLDVTAGLAPVDWFTVSGIAEYRRERAGPGNDPLLPSIERLPSGASHTLTPRAIAAPHSFIAATASTRSPERVTRTNPAARIARPHTGTLKSSAFATMRKVLALYPLRRLGRPEDVTPMVLLLASPLSSWTTGQVVSVNGGYAMP